MKHALAALGIMLLAGCNQQTYFYNGVKYSDPAQFRAAATADRASYVAQIKPLSAPLSKKRLVVALPDREYILAEKLAFGRNFDQNLQRSQVESDPLIGDYIEFIQMLPKMIEKKNLFSSVDSRTVSGQSSIQPTPEYDVLTLALATAPGGRDEFYYISEKSGKQIVQADGSTTLSSDRWNSFFDSIKAAMLR